MIKNLNYMLGYEASLNGWIFNMEMNNNQDYLNGWNDGWKKRYYRWQNDR